MRSVLIGVKRFITNKNTITIIALLGSFVLLYWAYNRRIETAISPKPVIVATTELGPRTRITSDMLRTEKIPGNLIENTYQTTTELIGKYVSNDAVIPANGIIYRSMVKEWEELPRSIYGDIPDGNTVVAIEVDLDSTYGNSIYPGNYIDLYYYDHDKEQGDKLMLQKFIESIKVLAVVDSTGGKSVFETNGALLTPKYLIFSVPEDLYLLLKKASMLSGTIFPVPRNASYSNGTPKETKIVCTYIKEFILKQTVDVNLKDGNKVINVDDGIGAIVIE